MSPILYSSVHIICNLRDIFEAKRAATMSDQRSDKQSDTREPLCTAMELLDLAEVQRILDETPNLLPERLRPDAGRGGCDEFWRR